MGMKTPEEINIEELKTGIERCIIYLNAGPSEESCDKCPYEGKCSRLEKDALALIQRLEAQVPKWISVEERLPEEVEYVLCIVKYGEDAFDYEPGLFFRNKWHTKGSSSGVVSHWMPLPEPPKEEEK